MICHEKYTLTNTDQFFAFIATLDPLMSGYRHPFCAQGSMWGSIALCKFDINWHANDNHGHERNAKMVNSLEDVTHWLLAYLDTFSDYQ